MAEVHLGPNAAWRHIVDGLHEAVIAADLHNLVVYLNPAAESLLGWSTGDLVGHPLTAIMPERFRTLHQAGFARFVATGEATVMGRPLRVPAQRADGSEIEVELVVTTAELAGAPIMIGLLRDVAERVELEGGGELADALVAALTEAPTLAEAMPRVLESLGDSLNWDVVQLWLLDEGAAVLRRRASWAREPSSMSAFVNAMDAEFGRGRGLPGRVWASAAPAWIDDVVSDGAFPRAAEAAAAGLRAGFAFPVVADGRIVGVVEMFSRQAHGVSEGLVQRMRALGSRLGGFIERRVAEEARLSLLESERLARTEAEQARSRLAFLSQASTVLSETLDLDVTLARVASLAVPALGDWCVIHLLAGDEVSVAAVAHADPAKVDALRALHELYPVDLTAEGGVGRAITAGTVIRHEQVTSEVLTTIARDERHLSLLRELDFGAVVTVPLQARNRRFGAVTVATDPARSLSDDTVDTVVELSRRAAMAIDNARLYRDLQLQAAMLRTRGEAGIEGQLVVGPAGDMISYNRRFVEMWGLPDQVMDVKYDQEALGVAAAQVLDPVQFRERVEHLYAARAPARDEVVLRDGRVFDRVGAPLFEEGVYLGYAWYFRDVTAHKQIEHELAEAATTSAALARTLQQSLLPPSLPNIPGLQLAARYVPASDGLEVGGDFYDVFRLGRGTWGVVVGDVCGHGAEAAAVTAFTRYTLRAAAAQTRSPARALRLLNQAMLRQDVATRPQRFVTVANARLSVRTGSAAIVIAIGGHPLPVLRQSSGATTLVGAPGTLIGVLDDIAVHDAELVLGSGDRLVIVTDGVLEARRDAVQFGSDRLLQLVAASGARSPDELADDIVSAAAAHARGRLHDDIAVLVIAVP